MNKNPLFKAPPAFGSRFRNLDAPSLGGLLAPIALLLIISLSLCHAASCTLTWNASSGPDVAGYNLRYGTTSGNPGQPIDVGNTTTRTVSNLNDATTYFFTVTAYNSARLESQPSNEISYTTPAPAATPTPTPSQQPKNTLTVRRGTGDGSYTTGTQVQVSANAPATDQQFDRWTGDYQIIANPSSSNTTATMPSVNATVTATYKAATSSPGDKIRYYPRTDHSARMVGGVFEGTDGDPVTGTYTTIYTINSAPPQLLWSEASVSLGNYRYLRYRAPSNSFGNVAEIEFYRNGVKLTGTGYGTPGSWNNSGNTFDKAL
ncbi:MAG: fibronectin type III domain-containing protein, partial [Terrimicrobiaceae bacterium]